jgi:hypothetical protein
MPEAGRSTIDRIIVTSIASCGLLSASPEDGIDAALSRSHFAFTKSLRPV